MAVNWPLYFGCESKEHIGHFVYDSAMRKVDRDHKWLWGLDGMLPPDWTHKEGIARVHRFRDPLNGGPLTLVAFWDRSADTRPGSNSVFVLGGTSLTNEEALAQAKAAFPTVWKRFGFEVTLER